MKDFKTIWNDAWSEAFVLFLENITLGSLIAGFIWAGLGVIFSMLIGTTDRDPLSSRTPVKFSWKFFWNDNLPRGLRSFFTGAIAILFSLRFIQDFIGVKFSMFYCALIGFGLDFVILKWKELRMTFGEFLKNRKSKEL